MTVVVTVISTLLFEHQMVVVYEIYFKGWVDFLRQTVRIICGRAEAIRIRQDSSSWAG